MSDYGTKQMCTKRFKQCRAAIDGKSSMFVAITHLLAAAQAVEHYEMTRYGTLKCWAKELGMDKAASLLDVTLQQEMNTDNALTVLAEGSVNDHAQPGK